MKKQLLSAAVLLGLAGGATAVNLNQDGTGQVLLYPYYTVNGSKDTLFNVVNTTGKFKAVKIRISEAANTWEVRDFNVYLSPWDVFDAGITSDADGMPKLVSADNSCTMPAHMFDPTKNPNSAEFTKLTPALIDHLKSVEPATFASLDVAQRIKEGHIEVIEMAEINDPVMQDLIKHGSNGVPGVGAYKGEDACSILESIIVDNEDSSGIVTGTGDTKPTGGLFGDGNIVDVTNGSSVGYNATAIDGFFTEPVHTNSGNSLPNLNGNRSISGVDVKADKVAQIVHEGQIFELQFKHPIQALGATLMADTIMNTYDIFEGTNSSNDWVVTFPTKHAHVNVNTLNRDGQFGLVKTIDSKGRPVGGAEPFTNGPCATYSMKAWSNEEQEITTRVQPSPVISNAAQALCNEANVLQFKENDVLKSNFKNAVAVKSEWAKGWAKIDFSAGYMTGLNLVDNETYTLAGYPVIGFSYYEARMSEAVDGTLRNYGIAHGHRYGRKITKS